jgi:ParB-like chromosome segregation protein Spo0J
MKAADWIDRVKAKRQIDSDYGVAKLLGLSRQSVSGYRSRIPTLDETTALSVAMALGEKPEAILLDQLAERTKDAKTRSALSKMARSLCVLC